MKTAFHRILCPHFADYFALSTFYVFVLRTFVTFLTQTEEDKLNTILYRDRVLLRTLSSPIYQNENRADSIKFLVSVDDLFEFDTKSLNCMLCITLPNGQEGKVTFLDFEDTLYFDRYLVAHIPVTKTFTKLSGTLSINLIFSYEDSYKLFHYLPTNNITLSVLETSSTNSFIDPDETTNPFTEMAQKLDTLEKSKISCIDIDGHTVHFYSNSEKTEHLGTVVLPEDVVWTTMEDTE